MYQSQLQESPARVRQNQRRLSLPSETSVKVRYSVSDRSKAVVEAIFRELTGSRLRQSAVQEIGRKLIACGTIAACVAVKSFSAVMTGPPSSLPPGQPGAAVSQTFGQLIVVSPKPEAIYRKNAASVQTPGGNGATSVVQLPENVYSRSIDW